jgi:hypothetical protein
MQFLHELKIGTEAPASVLQLVGPANQIEFRPQGSQFRVIYVYLESVNHG